MRAFSSFIRAGRKYSDSGDEAASHGMRDIATPGELAEKVIRKLRRRR